jgi:hypothetical protein
MPAAQRVRRDLGVCVGLLVSFQAIAGLVTPLNTFPASGVPDGPDAGLYSRVLDGQEIAVPFSVSAPGTIRSIDTGIFLGGGECGWRIGVVSESALYGSTSQIGFSTSPWADFVDVSASSTRLCNGSFTVVPNGVAVSLSDLDWSIGAGDYFLVAAWMSDTESATWDTNQSLLSDEWVIQAIGTSPYSSTRYPCGGGGTTAPWLSLNECGIAPQPTPAARIDFAPGLRLPEPPSLSLVLLALGCMLGVRQIPIPRRGSTASPGGA